MLAISMAAGCSSKTDEQKHAALEAPVPLAAVQSTPEAEAKYRITTWELYESRHQGYNVLARDRAGKVLQAINFHVISQSQSSSPQVRLDFGHSATMLIDQQRGVIQSSINARHLAIGQSLAEALKQNKSDARYDCLGDIFWSVGGFLGTIAACASVVPGIAEGPLDAINVIGCAGAFTGGLVAGTVSAWRDCGTGTASVSVEVDYDYYFDPDRNCWAYFGTDECYVGGGGDDNLPP